MKKNKYLEAYNNILDSLSAYATFDDKYRKHVKVDGRMIMPEDVKSIKLLKELALKEDVKPVSYVREVCYTKSGDRYLGEAVSARCPNCDKEIGGGDKCLFCGQSIEW